MTVSPQNGGCWYCFTDQPRNGEAIAFVIEFDTYVHPACAKARLALDSGDSEARLMVEELEARP